MTITKENKLKYDRLGIDTQKLKLYYIDRAKQLLECLKPYNDAYAKELKEVLKSFVKNQNKDLIDLIDEIKTPVMGYNSFGINDTMFDICYVDAELVESVLNDKRTYVK